MSEIIELFAKNGAGDKSSPVHSISGADAETAAAESSSRDASEAPPASAAGNDEWLFTAEEFDFSGATFQMKRAMDPGTILGEQLRILRTRLSLMQKQNGLKTVLMTSTVPQEGKSFTSGALAGVMAQESGKRIVVIDADLRKHGSGRDYGIKGSSRSIGTTQVLQGVSEFQKSLMKSVDPEFWFLPSGTLPLNPSELIGSPEMEKMLRFAAEKFDWVIVDGPPALALPDPSLIAPLCDTVVLVVRVKSTPAKLVNETINKIGRERICGVVLNRQKQIHSSRYYYQYYQSYQK